MAGAGEGGRPSSAPPPQGTRLSGVAVPQSHLSHPPQHQTKGEAPSPRGCSPPQPGLYIQWFSAVLWLRGQGVGEVARQSQLDSGSDLGLLVHPGTHSLCHLFF